ncbi:hypothetical protein LJC46_05310 [Desulfovibrio sp. OttesenSCG-928-G15]|nr:hypothetical protein [Desulfovibrio sp. OttesenSCG-928-G15]
MAEKKAIVVLTGAEVAASGSAMGKLLKKGALLPNYTAGNVLDGSVADAEITRLDPAGLAEAVEKGTALMVVDLGSADAAGLDAAVATVLEATDRRTTIAVAGKNALALYGQGINNKVGTVERAASAADVLPTLAAVCEFPLTDQATGAVLYQALKSPNAKLDEIAKLKEALSRMEGALARDNREPWDKHDCA